MMQHEITHPIPLLDESGNLTEPGFARRLLPVYDRSKVRSGALRIKEWDYYYVGNDQFGLALTIADNGYMGLDSISFLSFSDTPWQITKSPMRLLPLGRTALPATSLRGVTASSGKHHALCFQVEESKRILTAHMDRFQGDAPLDAHITLTDEPEESMVICTPFDKPGHFYYNQKINYMRANGVITIGGRRFRLDSGSAFGVLDWGRGVWTYHNTWYWGSGSGTVDGHRFGFNIGYGFGDTSAASENILFYDGVGHKLDDVTFLISDNYTDPWKFTSSDGRFEMDFVPIIDRAALLDVKLICSDQHQVFGRMSGTAVLDDGTKVVLKDFLCFAEKVHNKY